MKNPVQIANELETFKRQHGGGSIIDDAVEALRRQHEEIKRAEEMKHSFTLLLRWVKRVCGRRMCNVLVKKKHKVGFLSHSWITAPVEERQRYDMLISECETFVPNSGVYSS